MDRQNLRSPWFEWLWQDNLAQASAGKDEAEEGQDKRVWRRAGRQDVAHTGPGCRLHATRVGTVPRVHHRRNVTILRFAVSHGLGHDPGQDRVLNQITESAAEGQESVATEWWTAEKSVHCCGTVSRASPSHPR